MKNNPDNMMCLDVFLSNSDKETHQKTIDALQPTTNKGTGILSWGIHELFYGDKIQTDLTTLFTLSKSYSWRNNFNTIIKNNTYEA
ncbi:MAG: hypothetical protein ACPGU6_05245, partial [Tenacibaculum sp.]